MIEGYLIWDWKRKGSIKHPVDLLKKRYKEPFKNKKVKIHEPWNGTSLVEFKLW